MTCKMKIDPAAEGGCGSGERPAQERSVSALILLSLTRLYVVSVNSSHTAPGKGLETH